MRVQNPTSSPSLSWAAFKGAFFGFARAGFLPELVLAAATSSVEGFFSPGRALGLLTFLLPSGPELLKLPALSAAFAWLARRVLASAGGPGSSGPDSSSESAKGSFGAAGAGYPAAGAAPEGASASESAKGSAAGAAASGFGAAGRDLAGFLLAFFGTGLGASSSPLLPKGSACTVAVGGDGVFAASFAGAGALVGAGGDASSPELPKGSAAGATGSGFFASSAGAALGASAAAVAALVSVLAAAAAFVAGLASEDTGAGAFVVMAPPEAKAS